MTTLKKLDKNTVKKLQDEMRESMRVLAAKYGLTITSAGGGFETMRATLKFDVRVNDAEAAAAQEKVEFEARCYLYDLKPEHYRKEIVLKGELWRLVGFEPQRPKFCARMQNVATGKQGIWSRGVLDQVRGAKAAGALADFGR